MKSIVDETKLSNIVKTTIKKVLNENADKNMKLFTQLTKVTKDYVDKVFSEGLTVRDNGEANGIWFSRVHKFYSNMHSFCFSIPCTEEMLTFVNVYPFDWDADVMVAHNNIPIQYLKLEETIIGAYKRDGIDRWNYMFEESDPQNEKWWSPDRMRGNDKEVTTVIFRDMYKKLFGHYLNESDYKDIPRVYFDNYLFNDRWDV